jgi:hypothetical protein
MPQLTLVKAYCCSGVRVAFRNSKVSYFGLVNDTEKSDASPHTHLVQSLTDLFKLLACQIPWVDPADLPTKFSEFGRVRARWERQGCQLNGHLYYAWSEVGGGPPVVRVAPKGIELLV